MSTALTARRRPATLVGADGEPIRPATARADRRTSAGNGQGQKREPTKPIDEVRLGRVKAAIWQNEAKTDDGRGFVRYGVTFERIYRNADGQWRGTASFDTGDLLLLAKVAELAHARIHDILAERPM